MPQTLSDAVAALAISICCQFSAVCRRASHPGHAHPHAQPTPFIVEQQAGSTVYRCHKRKSVGCKKKKSSRRRVFHPASAGKAAAKQALAHQRVLCVIAAQLRPVLLHLPTGVDVDPRHRLPGSRPVAVCDLSLCGFFSFLPTPVRKNIQTLNGGVCVCGWFVSR